MQHSQRLDQKLYTLREEVRTMSREKEQVERVWRERLQRCQRQLQAKEDEMIRQSQYFESFKSQLQYKLKQGGEREEALQNRIYTLEKKLLDMTVTAATGLATMGPVRITSGSAPHWEEEDRLPSLRGEGEGEEEKMEERKKQWTKGLEDERGKDTDMDQTRLQGFILSLQEDLRVLLEREEKAMTEHRGLLEQMHEAQENSHFLGCKLEEMKSEIDHLNLSKASLEEEVEELREENQRLQQSLRDADNLPNNSDGNIEKASTGDEDQPSLAAVLPDHHLATAESSQNGPVASSSSAKSETSLITTNGPQTLFSNFGSKSNPSFQSLTLTTETIDELRMGAWCYNGVLNLEESPGEDSDALREAYRSLGFVGDLDFIKEQRDRFEEALQQAHEQLKIALLENASLKSQIEETGLKEDSSTDILCESSTLDDSARFSIGSDDLVQALNEENRALAERIQELRAHIELREEEIMKERSDVKEQICRLEIDGARQQQEINEQACLVTELTKKTEDDLNIIMELKQKLLEHEELKEEIRRRKLFGFQSKHTQTVFRKDNIDECVDIVVNCVIESDKEPQFLSKQETNNDASQTINKSIDNPEVNLMNDEVERLTKLVQSLKTEQEDLMGRVKTQRLQQKEVAQSIRAQTEEKQRLTREVWGLKEEKDHIFKSLSGLKQEREVLTRAVCGFKDEKDQFQRSMTGLQQEKEQLSQALPGLKKEKNAISESISNGIKERDHIMQSIQNLQKDSQQLNQSVFKLKQEKDELSNQLKSLKETKDKVNLCNSLEEECAKLQKSVCSLKEEERRMTFSVSRLKQEENQMTILIQQLQEEHSRLQDRATNQNKTSEVNSYQTNANAWGAEHEEQYQYDTEDQNDFTAHIQTLSAELQTTQDELEKTKAERQRLESELFLSENKRDEAERRASQLADRLFKISDESNQLQETRKESDNLRAQVKDLQSKVSALTREKNEALALSARIDEQYNVMTAQLKAKTVALQELNSEYISLKQGQGIKEDLSTALVSLQSRYNDIRAKYDALLHRKSQADMDIAPLKAKLSCMVVKCQERNNILVQMTKILQKHGCIDYMLKQQVEQLLSDPALQSYASTFTTGFTPEITVTFEDTKRLTQDHPCLSSPSKPQQMDDEVSFIHGSRSPSLIALSTLANSPRDCTSKMSLESSRIVKGFSSRSISPLPEHREAMASTSPAVSRKDASQLLLSPTSRTMRQNSYTNPIQEKKALSPNSLSPLQEQRGIHQSTSPAASQKSNTISTKSQLSPKFPRGAVLKANEFQQLNVKAKSTPDLTRLTETSGYSSSADSSSSVSGFGPNTRLSSPGKIMSLQEQLQKTLLSSFQAPADRGKGQQPRKSLSFSTQSLAFPTASQMKKPPVYNSANITTSSSQPTTGGNPKTLPSDNKLFNAVISRSATVTFSPVAQTFKPSKNKNVSQDNGSSAYISSAVQSKVLLSPNPGAIQQTNDTFSKELTASSMQSSANCLHASSLAPDYNVSNCPDTNSTASDTTGPSRSSSFNRMSQMDGGSLASPQPTSTSAKKSPNSAEKARTPTRIKQEAPAEVRSIEVIKTVGVSGLMIGWERPPLDELGCSNGTFVYGYRVFVDGVFHKSVMSSACTKCILENLNLSVPIKISVQTLGSNGLSSNCVHTMFVQHT